MKNDRKRILLTALLVIVLAAAMVWGLLADRAKSNTDIDVNQLVFSEICLKNDSIIAANDGGFHDYAELYNGGKDINLKGCYLTDGGVKSEPFGDFPFPSGSYCLLFLDKETVGFSLKSSGSESLSLMDSKGHRRAAA